MMFLNPSEVAVLGDYSVDRRSCESAGMKYYSKVEKLIPELGVNEPRVHKTVDTTGFKIPVTGIIGAICGDVIGSAYEFHPTDDYNFEPFVKRTHVTDDSVATFAIAKWLMGERSSENLVDTFLGVCNRHPNAGWGPEFQEVASRQGPFTIWRQY